MNSRGIPVWSCRVACYRCAKSFTGEAGIDQTGKFVFDIPGIWVRQEDGLCYCQNCMFTLNKETTDTEVQDSIRLSIGKISYTGWNKNAIDSLREALYYLERESAERRGNKNFPKWSGHYLHWSGHFLNPSDLMIPENIENVPTCKTCNHIYCEKHK